MRSQRNPSLGAAFGKGIEGEERSNVTKTTHVHRKLFRRFLRH